MSAISSVLPSFISSNGVNFAQSKPGKSEFGTVVTGIAQKPIFQANAPRIVIASGSSHYACSAKSSARPSVVSLGSIAKRLGMLLLLAPSVFGQSCGPTSSGFDAERKYCTGDTFIGDDCKGLNNATRDLFSAIEAHPSICIDGELHANVTNWIFFTEDARRRVEEFKANPKKAYCKHVQHKEDGGLFQVCLDEVLYQFGLKNNQTVAPTVTPTERQSEIRGDGNDESAINFKAAVALSMLVSVALYAVSFAMHFRWFGDESNQKSLNFNDTKDAGTLKQRAENNLIGNATESDKSGVNGVQKAYNDSWMKSIDQTARTLNGVMRVSLGLLLPLSINESLTYKPSQSAAVYFLLNTLFYRGFSQFSKCFENTETIQQFCNAITHSFKTKSNFVNRKNEFKANLYSDSFKGRLSHLTTNQKKELVKLADNKYPFKSDAQSQIKLSIPGCKTLTFSSQARLAIPLVADLLFTGILLAFNDDMPSDVTWAVPLTFAVLNLAINRFTRIDDPQVTYLNKVETELKALRLFDALPL